MLIELSGEARTKDAAFSLAEDLDASPMFSNAVSEVACRRRMSGRSSTWKWSSIHPRTSIARGEDAT